MNQSKRGAFRAFLARGMLAVSALTALVTPAFATTPANTLIGNQASVTYLDNSGASHTATSNLVQTLVQQVGAFTLTSSNTRSAAAGNVVYVEHTLTNTGNGTDSFNITVADNGSGADQFSNVSVYADPNATGLPGSTTPLCSPSTTPCSTGFVQSVAGNGGVFNFVVAYTIPSTATTSTFPSDTATVTAAPVSSSPVLSTYSPASISNTDTVTLTAAAVFSLTKSIATPTVNAPAGGTWPTALTNGAPSAATCTTANATWATMSPSTCTYTVFTLKYTNTGASVGDFSLKDALPAGFTYVTGSAVWSNASGTALSESGANPTGITYSESANTVTATVAGVGVTGSGTISFVALVNSSAIVGTSTTTNIANYSPTTCSAPCSTATTPTNSVLFTVSQLYGVVAANAASTTTDTSNGTAGNPNDSGIDQVLVPTVAQGGTVKFPMYITNTGNGTDTFNLATSNSNFPAGTTFSYVKSDGSAPLVGANTGPLAAGSNVLVYLTATLPANATVGSVPYKALVTATSTGAASAGATVVPDAVWGQVTKVTGGAVDLTNSAAGTGVGTVGNGDLGQGPSPSPTLTNTTPAGTGTLFPLYIANNDSVDNTYTLNASSSSTFPGSLPAGWTVKFVAAGGTCTSAAITSLAVTAGSQGQVLACVTPPTGTAATTQSVYFQAKSTSNASSGGLVSDALQDAVTVTVPVVPNATLTPNNAGQIAPGGTIIYPQAYTNTGNQSCGTFTVAATLSAADQAAGFTAAIYIDTNGNGQIDETDTLVTGTLAALAPGQSYPFLVKIFAPAGAAVGYTSTVTLSVTDNNTGAYSQACPAVSATDTSTIISGQVRLLKTQAADPTCSGNVVPASNAVGQITVKPGSCIVYQIVATNQGGAPVTNVSVSGAIPSYTTYGTTQPASQCTSTNLTGTAVALTTTGTPVSTVSCGSAANTLSPNGTVTTTFEVKVN